MVLKRQRTYKKPFLVTLAVIILLCGTIGALEFTNTTHLFHKQATSTTGAATPTIGGGSTNNSKGETQPTQQSSNSGSADNSGDDKNISGGSNGSGLLLPTGNFVSAHRASLSTRMASICNTTPGASCKITFIKDGVTKSLAGKTVGSDGSAYWTDWSLSSIGVTTGTWHIRAVATLNGQTKSADDALVLEVVE